MISQDREQLRRFYLRCWEKQQAGDALMGVEQQIAEVIGEHPEYHAQLKQGEKTLGREYLPEQGEANPFLHMSLHLGIREQVVTDRPEGIRAIYQQLIARFGVHEAEHAMMQCLAESLWLAQAHQTPPDEGAYLETLQALLVEL